MTYICMCVKPTAAVQDLESLSAYMDSIYYSILRMLSYVLRDVHLSAVSSLKDIELEHLQQLDS
jgi:hypothetical protein